MHVSVNQAETPGPLGDRYPPTGGPTDERGSEVDFEKYLCLARRRRWYFLIPFFCSWLIVWVITWAIPPVYRSGTLILVEQQQVPQHYVVPNVASELQDRLQSMSQQILSRTRLLQIIEELNLYPNERSRLSPEQLVERMRKDIEIELVQSPDAQRHVSAFNVYYSAENPRIAQEVTSQLTSMFIEENLKVRQQQSERTTDFLSSQLVEAGKSLATQDERLREFKMHYLGQLPGQLQTNIGIMSGMQARLQSEMEALNQAKQQNVYLNSLLSQYQSLRIAMGSNREAASQTPAAINEELQRLRTRLAELRAHYTDSHPDIQRLKIQITQTEKTRSEIASALAAAKSQPASNDKEVAAGYGDAAGSPIMQVESQLKANELEIRNRETEIKQLESDIRDYQGRLNLTPVREEQLAALTRDYEQSRANYDALLAKKNQSELATNLEKRAEGEQFQVLDPPNLPRKPYKPDRLKMSFIAVIVGLAIGLAAATAAEIADERIYGEDSIRKLFPQGVLAEIPPLPTSAEQQLQRQRIRWEWALASMILGTIVAGTLFSVYRTYLG